jgi:hypothetical protein
MADPYAHSTDPLSRPLSGNAGRIVRRSHRATATMIPVFLANQFAERHVQVSLIDLARPPADRPSLDDFDTVLVGAPRI